MTWTVQLFADGEPVIDPCPVHLNLVAEILAGVTCALWGGPVSILKAVMEAEKEPAQILFEVA